MLPKVADRTRCWCVRSERSERRNGDGERIYSAGASQRAQSEPDSDLVSRAFFSLDLGGNNSEMSVTLRQPFGANHAANPIEVETPEPVPLETGTTSVFTT